MCYQDQSSVIARLRVVGGRGRGSRVWESKGEVEEAEGVLGARGKRKGLKACVKGKGLLHR